MLGQESMLPKVNTARMGKVFRRAENVRRDDRTPFQGANEITYKISEGSLTSK